MTLILRKCKGDGSSSNGFKYGQVGDRVMCPDWHPNPECGNGLHGLKEGNGDWGLLDGNDWLIIDADDLVVDIDEEKCKFNTGVILFRGTTEELVNSEFPNKLKLDEKSAYYWAIKIGNHDIMINKINTSKCACYWAMDIGNHDLMINKITESFDAYLWALEIGNQDIMIHRINDSESAYLWALEIGNEDIMIDKINESEWAFYWAKYIDNKDVMMHRINNSYYAYRWALEIGNHDIMIDKITSSVYVYNWFKNIGLSPGIKCKVIIKLCKSIWNFTFPKFKIKL